ncbi:DUF6449 domain-containing protein [[Clostridium] scindens]|uniref:DUF6449 domain-containing protein n=1 Tax=Clostridium scindens (strain JCM 10418 / VPI 12708) TaxID=29347 RepID=UPI003AB5EE4F
MTSAKYYSNWLKEAGRGHISAILAWGGFALYLIFKVMSLSVDTDFSFFGIGSAELSYLCMGLGILLAFSEFNYLFQAKKQDFYYSLPVKRNTIFWTRYFHGLLHFAFPFLITQAVCAVYQAGRDTLFAPYASVYTVRSVIVFFLVFLLFYHMGLMAAAVSGRVAFAVAVLAVLLFYFEILAQYVLLGMSQEIFHTFYRIPLLEEAGRLLVPARLADTLAGTFLYEKREVLEYFPNGGQICAALAWILLLGVAILLVLGRRKTEMTGRGFASRLAERVTEFLLSVLAGLCVCTLILKIFHTMGEGGLKGVLCLTLAGVVGTLAVHLLVEGLVRVPLRKIARRKGQLAAECIAVCVAALAFLEGRDSFDGFYPRPDQIKGLSIFMNGVDIDQAQYEEIEAGRDHYLIDSRLAQYSLHDNGMEEGLAWLRTVCRQGKGSGRVTTATVCYEMKSGAMKYRTYPVDEESLDAFAGVYECGEYKEKAYPLTEIKEAEQERLVWSDGVLEQTLRLTAQEKKDFLAAYKADVDSLKLAELKESLPVGYIELESEVSAKDMRAAIYPFFGRTCNFLKEHGADVGKQIEDYKIVGLKVKNMPSGTGKRTGNTGIRFYQEEEDLEAWRGKLVPEDLAIQPILHPVDGRTYAEAEIKDEDTSSVTITQCYGKAK